MAISNDGTLAFIANSMYDGTNWAQLVMKLDGDRNVLWTKACHFDEMLSQGARIVPTQDAGFIISGSGTVLPNTKTKSFVYKIDSSGSFVWGVRSQDTTEDIESR